MSVSPLLDWGNFGQPGTKINKEIVMKFTHKGGVLAAALVSCSLLAGAPAHADSNYPAKAISIVVGYPAGGSVDLTARVLGEELSERLGQSVVIENLGGAGGTIGAHRVVRATPDGYTLLLGSTNEMVIAGRINESVRYDVMKDFTHVGMIAAQPMLFTASPEVGVKTAQEYIEKLKSAAPGEFNFGSSGIGTTLHLAGEMINESTGTKSEHVPYRGVAPLLTDMVSGQLHFGVYVMSSGLPHVKAGKVIALGTTESKRSAAAPDIPALAETPGFEDVDINVWFGLYGPAGMPDEVVSKLRTVLAEALQSDTLRDKLAASGASLYAPDVDPVKFYESEAEKYGKLIDLAGIGRAD